jgi:acetyl-CoA carboxylase biotin carboxyl carrier protein
MAENPLGPTEPLDVQRIHYLVRLMKRYNLTALDVSSGPIQVRLRRRGPQATLPASVSQPPPITAAAAQTSGTNSPAPPRTPPAESPAPAKTVVIESPMVGTYYASSAPDAPPFVSARSVVQPDTIVCTIEAMKVYTDIPAGVSGTIVEIMVKNGQAVEFGQPLFRVIPA